MHNTIFLLAYIVISLYSNMKWISTRKYIGDVRPSLMALHSLESISK